MKKLILIILFLFIVLPLFVSAQTTSPFSYTPLENIPGSNLTGPTDFYAYVSAIYKFGIWAVGIVALFMLVFGGYTYITSAGNNSSMETAKRIITDAIVGVIMALTAYLLLYVINPDLVKMKKLTPVAGIPGAQVPVTPIPGVPGALTCTSGKCSQIDSALQTNASGVDPNTLKSLLVAGEGCNKAASGTGPCGYSQATATNRKAVCGLTGTAAETCALVQNNTPLDINCGAAVVADMLKSSKCQGGIVNLASCYATGAGAKFACGNPGDTNYCNRVAAYYATCK